MRDKRLYDVIIIGAGISGLLLASELSKDHSILLIEQEESLPNGKYWVTGEDSTKLVPELLGCIDRSYDFLDFIGHDGTRFRAFGKAVLWDTDKLLSKLYSSTIQNGGNVRFNQRFYNFSYKGDKVSISANSSTYTANLIVDCMGIKSPLIHIKSLIRSVGYYIIYGGLVELKKQIDPIALGNIMIDNKPKYLEIFPTSDNKAYFSLIYPSRQLKNSLCLKNDFEFIISKSEYSTFINYSRNVIRTVSGLIPISLMRKRGFDNIYFYGEAGQINPAATATCLHRMLITYKKTSNMLSKMLNEKLLDKNSLSAITGPITKWNQRFQISLYKHILSWNSSDYADMLKELSSIDSQLFSRILTGELSKDDFKSILYNTSFFRNKRKKLISIFFKSIF